MNLIQFNSFKQFVLLIIAPLSMLLSLGMVSNIFWHPFILILFVVSLLLLNLVFNNQMKKYKEKHQVEKMPNTTNLILQVNAGLAGFVVVSLFMVYQSDIGDINYNDSDVIIFGELAEEDPRSLLSVVGEPKKAQSGVDLGATDSVAGISFPVDPFVPSVDGDSVAIQFSVHLSGLLSDVKEEIVSTSQDNISKETKLVYERYGNELALLILKQDWTGVVDVVTRYRGKIPDIDSVTANLMLLFGTPLEYVEEFVINGGNINNASTLSLLREGRINDLITLENFGVTYDTDLPLDMSLMDMALMARLPPESFDFLLSRSNNIGSFNPQLGTDTLSIALLAGTANESDVPNYINRLINEKGVQVSEHHLTIFERVVTESPTLAENIARVNPEFN